ncbi:MAG: eutC [Hyphomicrobiales bacterium]|nr:eutC [Hyphomicrobiales bacterium]
MGDALPTAALLDLQMAHAKARDAVHGQVNWERIAADLAPLSSLTVRSAAHDRANYLRRPDLGRRLDEGAADRLPRGPFDVVFVIADGLSAAAVQNHAVATLKATQSLLSGLSSGPVVLATQARVALSDAIGAAMNARMVVMLIGERPGLSAADSLGAYLTFAPAPGRRDSERNCVSNIHANGLSPQRAAARLAWLVREALRLGLTGVGLKEAAPQSSVTGETQHKIEG